jgi:hypothetical protein
VREPARCALAELPALQREGRLAELLVCRPPGGTTPIVDPGEAVRLARPGA